MWGGEEGREMPPKNWREQFCEHVLGGVNTWSKRQRVGSPTEHLRRVTKKGEIEDAWGLDKGMTVNWGDIRMTRGATLTNYEKEHKRLTKRGEPFLSGEKQAIFTARRSLSFVWRPLLTSGGGCRQKGSNSSIRIRTSAARQSHRPQRRKQRVGGLKRAFGGTMENGQTGG